MTPFTRVILLLLVAWLVIDLGIAAVSAPVPNSVVLMYMAIVFVGVLIYASDEERK